MIDYFAQHLWQMWALVCIVCLILELTNGDFFIMCFAIGAICSAVLSAFGLPFYAGLAVFAAASVLSLFFIRPTLMKKLHPRESLRRSNADALIGRTARVSQTIVENGFGRVALDGDGSSRRRKLHRRGPERDSERQGQHNTDCGKRMLNL